MPSVWKKIRRSLRRRKSSAPRSNRKSRNKQKIEHPNSPSSILQIDEIQHHELPEQSGHQVSMDDDISRLSMPSLIEDADVRAGGAIEAVNEERSFEVGTAMTSEQASSNGEEHVKTLEPDSSDRVVSEEINFVEEADMEVSSDGSAVEEKHSAEDLESNKLNQADMEASLDGSTVEENYSSEDTEPIVHYNRISDVPAKCQDIIGRRVKVRDSLNDVRKRNKIGCITAWKDSITVTMKCDEGDSFGVRLANVEFAGKSEGKPQLQAEMTQDCTQTENATLIDSSSTFPYKSPSEVPGNCPSIIGMKVKVRESLSDSTKRGKIGVIVEWKTRNTVSLKCEDGQSFGVRLSSINFVDQQVQPKTNEHHTDEINPTEKPILDDTSSYRSPNSFQSVEESHSTTETFVTARMNSVISSDDLDSNMVMESNPGTSSHEENNEEILDKVVAPTEKLTKAPPANEQSAPDEPAQNSRFKEPTEVPAKDNYIIGKRVKVRESLRDSKKRGKLGSVVRWKNKSTVEVACDDGVEFGVRLENIQFANGHEPSTSNNEGENSTGIDRVRRQTSRRHTTQNSDSAKPRKRQGPRANKKSPKVKDDPPKSDICKDWIAPQNPEVMPKFGGFHIEKLVVRNGENAETTFLNNLLKQRKLVVEVPLSSSSAADSIEKRVEDGNGNVHELVSCKTYTESTGSKFVQRKIAKVIYAQTHGPELKPFAVDDCLLRIGDFMTIPPRKIAARLELFQSPSNLQIVSHEDDSWFQRIPDLGYVGGGFIHEDTLFELLIMAGMGNAGARRVAAVQVRIFIPSMGIFKGMLVKKRIRNGPPIELPCSMQKVAQSSHPQRFNGSCILICRNKVHPSPGSANEYIGRQLHGSKPPPKKSFPEKIKKPLSQMIFRLWETMGVPKDLCDRYKRESILPTRRNHAWLVGVPDPTGCLPPDSVFVPGIKKTCDLFVTRCPCYAHEHGRKFHSFAEKPPAMSADDWEWLNNEFMFGVIIFSNPRPGMMSIPERIANGDLDGDLYLVCWDKEVVDCMTALPLEGQPAEDDGKLSTVLSNPNWFHEAQDVMVDNLRFELGRLIGALYKLAEKIADKSEKKLDDPDALALFEAYNEALEYQKHGRPIRLPRHLIKELKPNIRPLVQPLD